LPPPPLAKEVTEEIEDVVVPDEVPPPFPLPFPLPDRRTTRPDSGTVRPATSEARVGSEIRRARKQSFIVEVNIQASQKLRKKVQEGEPL
jgi:hypothetical protein